MPSVHSRTVSSPPERIRHPVKEIYYRLRVGDFRVLFTIASESIVIVRVRHRSDLYRWSSSLTATTTVHGVPVFPDS